MKKRILAFLLAGAMTLTMASTEAFGAELKEQASVENQQETETLLEDETAELAEKLEELTEQTEAEQKEASQEEAGDTETEEAKNQSEERRFPVSGVQKPQAIEISQETAAALDVVDEKDVAIVNDEVTYRSEVYGSQKYDSSWDIYSSNYIYNRLSAKERNFWDLLDDLCRKYLTTTANGTLMNLENGSYYATSQGIGYAFLGLTDQEVSELFVLFSYSNPQYYFLGNGYLYVGGAMYPVLYDEFAKGTARKAETAKVKSQIDSMKSQIEKGTNDVEKAKIAHDLIIEKITYDPGFFFDDPQPYTPFHQSAYSVFCDDYTVCAGYTKAFEILMNGVGIDTIGVTSETHAWNAICFNDTWYYIDLTWDDADGDQNYEKVYNYFGLSEKTITGSMDQKSAHRKEAMYAGLTPKCTRDFGSTQAAIGTVYTPEQTTAAPTASQKKTSSGMAVTLKTATAGADIYYTIDGKNPSASYTRSYRYTGTFKVTANVTVKAVAVCDGKWDSSITAAAVNGKMCTVKFNTMGGKKLSAKKVWPGAAVSKPANPKRAKYTFAGWYKDKKCTVKFNFSSKITKDTTVYAKWNKVKVGKASIRKLKNVSGKKMTVSIQKVSKAKGYQIRYSTNSKLKSAKNVVVKTTSKTIAKLKAGKKYYVQVRAYKLDSAGKKVWGNWSSTKAVTIRK